MRKDYDLIVIGTGSAGTAAAHACSDAGWSVAITDSRPFGGTGALHGGNPKKILIDAAEVVERSRDLRGRGIAGELSLAWDDLMAFIATFTETFPASLEEELIESGIDPYHGHTRFTGKNSVLVGKEQLSARHIVIATGAVPRPLGIPGEEYLTNSEELFSLGELPGRILFIGGGYISFELSHAAARAGSRVLILSRGGRCLKQFDRYLVDMLVEATLEAGIDVVTNSPVHSISRRSEEFLVHAGPGGELTYTCDMVVHGAGRIPALDSLDLGKAGITVNSRGIIVNEYLQSISNPAVYVAGDANGRGIPLNPVASMEGRIVARNLLSGNSAIPDYAVVPTAIFTIPPLARVGITEEEAQKQNRRYEVLFEDTSSWYTTRRIGQKASGYKILVDPGAETILGAHLLGHNADEVINIFALAMKADLSLDDIRGMIWAYPTGASDIRSML